MTIDEAKNFAEDMRQLFYHFESAVKAVGDTSIEQLMLDYPTAARFYEMMRIYENPNPELPF